MYKIVIISLLVFVSLSATSQKIIYDFPPSVTKLILQQKNKFNDTTKFFVLFNSENLERYSVSLVNYSQKRSDFKLLSDVVISKTDRFVRIDKYLIPLITREDIEFADFGSEETPNSGSPNRRIGKLKVIFNNDQSVITFDKSGKIFSN